MITELKRGSDKVLFWGKSNKKYWPFSNFYPCSIFVDGKMWPSTEHYYQAMKTIIPEEIEAIRLQTKAFYARKMGREVRMVDNWDDIKNDVMYKVVYAKFNQISQCRALLLSTGDLSIHEDSPHDFYWGWRNHGADKLGQILVRVREELRQKMR